MTNLIIGIDPDLEKSGVAILSQSLELKNLTFSETVNLFRSQHNIFEVGDKVVSINSAFIEYQGILNIDFIDKFNLMLSDDSKGFEVNAICGWSKIIRHTTNAEIAAGKRLDEK